MISRTFLFLRLVIIIQQICDWENDEKRPLPEFLRPIISPWISIERIVTYPRRPPPKRPNLISIRSWKYKTREQNPRTTVDCSSTIVQRFLLQFLSSAAYAETLRVHLTQIPLSIFSFSLYTYSRTYGGTLEQISIYQFFIHEHRTQLPFLFIKPIMLFIDHQAQFAKAERVSTLEILF